MKKIIQFSLVLPLFLIIIVGCSDGDNENQNNELESNNQEENVLNEDNNNQNEDNNNQDEANDNQNNDQNALNEVDNAEDKDQAVSDQNTELNALKELETDLETEEDEDSTADADLDLGEILGTANQLDDEAGIWYDAEEGYFILDLQAGLSNYTNTQDLNEKWVAFAIPDGVSIPDVDDIPSGVVVVALPDGHTGVAVKVPNLKGISSENVYMELPLIGEPDDNDPNDNLYLYNVDGNEESAELVGEIKSTRDIDFSVMTEESD